MLKRFIPIILALVLTGCSGLGSGVLGGLGTAGLTWLGDTVGADMRDVAAWQAKQTELSNLVVTSMMSNCRSLEAPDMTMATACYEKVLAFHEGQQPQILLERLAQRVRKAKARGRGARAEGDSPAQLMSGASSYRCVARRHTASPPFFMAAGAGIEPTLFGPKPNVLPLNEPAGA